MTKQQAVTKGQGKPLAKDASPFGSCPKCGSEGEFLNVRATHWFVCHEHRLRWCAGSNLFSHWREESPEDWKRNAELLRGYAEVTGGTRGERPVT